MPENDKQIDQNPRNSSLSHGSATRRTLNSSGRQHGSPSRRFWDSAGSWEGQRSRSRRSPSSRSSSSTSSDDSRHESNPTAVHEEAAHMLTGETRFPSALSYMSEAQRSDIATVGSGSVMEDVEIDSVYSTNDSSKHIGSPTEGSVLLDAPRASVGDNADGVQPQNMSLPSERQIDSLTASHNADKASAQRLKESKESHRLSSRAELGSDQPYQEQPAVNISSVASNSQAAEETNNDVDSLDVEANSIGSRSIRSHEISDERSGSMINESSIAAAASNSNRPKDTDNPLFQPETCDGGRRSPGGTIYKGRGSRRYQGRHMHLPLKRFHEGTSHLNLPARTLNGANMSSNHVNGVIIGYDPRNSDRGHLNGQSTSRHHRQRSRSRSRSPPDDGGDRKPRAK